MEQDIKGKEGVKPVNRLKQLISTLAYADYECIDRLQAAISATPGGVEVVTYKKSEAIKLWHCLMPLYTMFLPLWLVCAAILHKEPVSAQQSAACLFMIGISAICYLITFYRDSLRYRSNLIQVRQNLLSATARPMPQNPAVLPAPKGCIPLLLLQELVKKEAGYANLFDAAVEDALPMYQKMMGFNEKHFKKMMTAYRRRQDITPHQENARTTHVKYLDYIIQHYKGTGELTLERQAIALQTFLNTTELKTLRQDR